ncbi:hypothetical protein HK104_009326 [Borealophlyctis nickersoniae]|nr:hypothetical protein HK104_009326 [Borealophlyctis nickersoniae]
MKPTSSPVSVAALALASAPLIHAIDVAPTTLNQYLTNDPAPNGVSKLLLDTPFVFPDHDMRKYNPFLNKSVVDAYPSGAQCDIMSNGQICRDRPAYGSGLAYLSTPTTNSKWGGPTTPFKVFLSHTDRGPNQDCEELADLPEYNKGTEWEDRVGEGFPVQQFSPTVFSWVVGPGGVRVLKSFWLKDSKGHPVPGRSNTGNDDVNYPYACRGAALPLTPGGLDFEDIHPHPNGVHFWGSEEYSPSIFMFDATGEIKTRLIPSSPMLANLTTASANYPITPLLPPILTERRQNRGFENLALSPSGTTLYAILQSPIGDKSQATMKKTRVIRAVKVDVSNPLQPQYVGMYAFLASAPTDYTKGEKPKATDIKYSAAQYLGNDTILILERAEKAGMKLFTVDFSAATNMKGLYDASLAPEMAVDPSTLNITFAKVSKVFDSDTIPNGDTYFAKTEGLAVLSPTVVATVTDNDFGLNKGGRSQLDLLHLTSTLPFVRNVTTTIGKPKCEFPLCTGRRCYAYLPGPAHRHVAAAACEIVGGKVAKVPFYYTVKSFVKGVGVPTGKDAWVVPAGNVRFEATVGGEGKVLSRGKGWKAGVVCEVARPAVCGGY